MPPWPSRILSPSSNHHVESPITSASLNRSGHDDYTDVNLDEVPILHPTPSQYSLNGSERARSSHGRSVSQPFPSILTSKRTRSTAADERFAAGFSGISRDDHGKAHTPTANDVKGSRKISMPNGKETAKEDDLQTGNCLTCDSMVRWPKQLDVYRCTNCLMINDLNTTGNTTIASSGKGGHGKIARKTLPLTVHTTKDLTEQCVLTYLRERVDEFRKDSKSSKTTTLPVHIKEPNGHGRTGGKQGARYLAPNAPNAQTVNPRSFPPTRITTMPLRQADQVHMERSASSEPERPAWKQIFVPLEDYLVSCLQDCSSLNASFALERPCPSRISSENNKAHEKHHKRDGLVDGQEGMFELDAKTLLLGDIGENGQWWTGERQANPIKSRKEEEQEKRPSRFDWDSIYAWYDTILLCGKDWKSHAATLPVDSIRILLAHESDVDEAFGQARYHVQRTLLKSIEILLRRPGKPLSTPDDTRFLVVLLANPLLYPRPADTFSAKSKSPMNKDESLRGKANGDVAAKSQGIANGHHSGIIKRILGMVANLPLLCHQAVISWFCRVSESQFRDLVELVGGFVSYRLTRQKGRSRSGVIDVTAGLIPDLSGPGGGTSAHLHAAIGETAKAQKQKALEKEQAYRDDWQVKAAAKVMSLLFSANLFPRSSRYEPKKGSAHQLPAAIRQRARKHSQLLPTNFFYNTRLDFVDLVGDFEVWEARRGKFSFCQYPMFLSIWAKIHILEHDARRQMEIKARDAFFTTIMKGKAVSQFLVFKVRRDCLADDSLKNISQIIGGGEEEIKKSLRIEFIGEEGVDAGGLRKEWFLLLTREVFDPEHGLFIYDPDSNYCYFNPFSFETSDQFFLIGVLLGLAIYNSTILDVSLPPVAFRKLLASAPNYTASGAAVMKQPISYTLADLAEWKPSLARGLQQLLDHEGDDVEEIFCRDFVVEVERYGQIVQIPLCSGGEKKAVTNANRKEFVDLYIRYLLDTSVARQYEPFKRGFFSVCGGNALSLFRPEEIELLIRGSDEPLDVASIRAVSTYEHCSPDDNFVRWFWEVFESAEPKYQREILAFITGSDRIPAMGATSLVIKIVCQGRDTARFPTARTCFNVLVLWPYSRKEVLASKLWRAVQESEGFGLK